MTVYVPVGTDDPTDNVKELNERVGLVSNDAFTPSGRPLTLRVTAWLNPFKLLISIVDVPPLFCATLTLLGAADIVKSPGTVSVIVVDELWLPEVPVIVTVTVPEAAVFVAFKVRVLLDVAGLGLKDAVTPLGSPVADRVTLPENPFASLIAMVLVALPLFASVREFGVAVSVKLAGVIVRLTVVVWVRLPEVPVIVTVVVPGDAAALVVKVSVLDDVAGF
jgi:hypothetical protein